MRVFSIAGLRCRRCSTPMVVLALISDPPVVATILSHLGLPAAPPATAIAPRGARRGREPEGGRFAGELFVELDQPVGEAVDLGADAPWRDDAPLAPRDDDDRAPPGVDDSRRRDCGGRRAESYRLMARSLHDQRTAQHHRASHHRSRRRPLAQEEHRGEQRDQR